MTQINSNLTGQLQASLGAAVGSGIEMPDALLPVISLPLPLASILPNPASVVILEHTNASYLWSPVINQGASSGPTAAAAAIDLDRGVYRISGSIMSVTLVGPAPSSAAIKAARLALYEPNGNFAIDIAHTALMVGTPQYATFSLVLHLSKSFWALNLETTIASGVGQSMGVEGAVYIEKLV